jgi:hypothetical protein
MRRLIPAGLAVCAAAAVVACAPAGGIESAPREPPPAPLDSLPLASDVRLDSAGYLAGSFVGEGTSRQVHLLSSDTVLIEVLARRFRPDLFHDELGLWHNLSRARVVSLTPRERRRTVAGRGPRAVLAMVGSPLGHTEVTVSEVLLRGSRCVERGARGASAELLVQTDPAADDPPLRGPVLGTFLSTADSDRRERGLVRRGQIRGPSAALVNELIERTALHLDSTLAAHYPELPLRPFRPERIEVNTLADIDAADVIPFRADGGRVRYAVSLRQRRAGVGRDTLVATAVMAWDSAGAWRQEIFQPTLLSSTGGRLDAYGPGGRPVYWRRLQPISDVAYSRDNIWMEQVNVRDGRVVWGIIQPRGNVVVAAAEVEGACG